MAGGAGAARLAALVQPALVQPAVGAVNESARVKDERIKSLESQIVTMKETHEAALKLKEADVKIEMQPKLTEAYQAGYNACMESMKEARKFLNPTTTD